MNSNAKRDAVIEKLSKRHCWPNASLADAYEGGFLCGYVARDAEVAELRAQLKSRDDALTVAVEALEEIAIEQEFFVIGKDYFHEVVRLNLTARDAFDEINTLLGREKV